MRINEICNRTGLHRNRIVKLIYHGILKRNGKLEDSLNYMLARDVGKGRTPRWEVDEPEFEAWEERRNLKKKNDNT